LARVAVDRNELDRLGPQYKLVPGMPAEVLIVTGERTMFQYLFRPFLDALRRSFREA
jgi:HlyD family secretion protein/epimerase transport system membrane fusion protein